MKFNTYIPIIICLALAPLATSQESKESKKKVADVSKTAASVPVPAQEFVIRFSGEELNYVVAILRKQPLEQVLPLFESIRAQIKEQQKDQILPPK